MIFEKEKEMQEWVLSVDGSLIKINPTCLSDLAGEIPWRARLLHRHSHVIMGLSVEYMKHGYQMFGVSTGGNELKVHCSLHKMHCSCRHPHLYLHQPAMLHFSQTTESFTASCWAFIYHMAVQGGCEIVYPACQAVQVWFSSVDSLKLEQTWQIPADYWLTHWPLGDVAVMLDSSFSNSYQG